MSPSSSRGRSAGGGRRPAPSSSGDVSNGITTAAAAAAAPAVYDIEALLPSAAALEAVFDRLWPLCRSITGRGVRETVRILGEVAPFEAMEVPTGTKVLDWEVPREWDISEAFIEDEAGRRVVDLRDCNLHVVGYSVPVDAWLGLDELQAHLHSLPGMPDAVPYATSYYQERWGFCLADRRRRALKPGRYHAVIRSALRPGSLTMAHRLLPAARGGSRAPEILLSSYVCHPSMANNELSGPIATAFLAAAMARIGGRRFAYRFVLVPEAIGAIAYLCRFGRELKRRVRAGYVVSCVGDSRAVTYKRSRRGDSEADRVAVRELAARGKPFKCLDFFPWGSDERQYCSPGYDLPVGSIMRSLYGSYPEYHTSLDDKGFISFEALRESIGLYLRVLLALEANRTYRRPMPFGEPMLSRRGVYPTLGAPRESTAFIQRMQWLLNQCDGSRDLCAVAEKAGCSILDLAPVARLLEEKGLLAQARPPGWALRAPRRGPVP